MTIHKIETPGTGDIEGLLRRAKALVEAMPAAPTPVPEVPDHILKAATAMLGPQDARYTPAALGGGGADIEAVKAAIQSLDPQDDSLAKAALAAAKARGDLDRPQRTFYV